VENSKSRKGQQKLLMGRVLKQALMPRQEADVKTHRGMHEAGCISQLGGGSEWHQPHAEV
jgi:hypothetical protein